MSGQTNFCKARLLTGSPAFFNSRWRISMALLPSFTGRPSRRSNCWRGHESERAKDEYVVFAHSAYLTFRVARSGGRARMGSWHSSPVDYLRRSVVKRTRRWLTGFCRCARVRADEADRIQDTRCRRLSEESWRCRLPQVSIGCGPTLGLEPHGAPAGVYAADGRADDLRPASSRRD